MACRNHPGVEAVGRCAGCADDFCNNCLVQMGGQYYCGQCKTMAVQAVPAAGAAVATVPCKAANEALTYAIIGLFCFGIILEPIALVKASKARQEMAMNPYMTGSGKATAATVIAIVGLALWVLGMIVRFSNM